MAYSRPSRTLRPRAESRYRISNAATAVKTAWPSSSGTSGGLLSTTSVSDVVGAQPERLRDVQAQHHDVDVAGEAVRGEQRADDHGGEGERDAPDRRLRQQRPGERA